ncbi:MAG TPA: DUF5684 domain-containing protein [Opitutaceae bacterium]|nr:DUF5684 domain-containing protein [Opitutaceae bacterium]
MIAMLFGLVLVALYLAVALFFIIAAWKVFTKAGKPGWGIFIPIYNLYLWVKIAGRSGWWVLLFLIPFVNIVIGIIVAIDVAKAFGKSGVWGFFLLFLLTYIGIAILGYGKAVYTPPGPPAAPPAPAPAA